MPAQACPALITTFLVIALFCFWVHCGHAFRVDVPAALPLSCAAVPCPACLVRLAHTHIWMRTTPSKADPLSSAQA